MQKQNFQLFAKYNRWINERLFSASAQLDEDALDEDRGAFFGSLLGTLNHIMVGDIVWLKRFAQGQFHFESLNSIVAMENPSTLDAQLYPTLATLWETRQSLDTDILLFTDEISTEQLESTLNYTNFQGSPFNDKFGLLLQHLFNHQTHHRGQASTLLSQAGIDIGPTDLLVCLREL